MKQEWPSSGDYPNARAFRAAKRRDIRNVLNALEELRKGCALTPAYSEIKAATHLLNTSKDKMSIARWKR